MSVSEGPQPKLNTMLNAGVPLSKGLNTSLLKYTTGTGKEEGEEPVVFVLQMGNYKVWRHLLCVSLKKTWDLNHSSQNHLAFKVTL